MTAIVNHVLIVGAGEFGLSTALALLQRPSFNTSRITILDSSSILPNPSGSSVDASRIIRSDYACKPYATLASQAQVYWRDQSDSGWGGQGRYSESGFVLTADKGAEWYVEQALENVRILADADTLLDAGKIEELTSKNAIQSATQFEGVSGDKGYANWNSGWSNAEAVMRYALQRVQKEGGDRMTIRSGAKVESLIIEDGRCYGVISDNQRITADLTVLSAGAWTPSLINLEGRCLATGQVLSYVEISSREQEELAKRPVIMNMSQGSFIIPPEGGELKIARHGFGYTNPTTVQHHDTARVVSVPRVGMSVPLEGQEACRKALRELLPHMGDRPFTRTRICWYCDTPGGDFLIDYHPDYQNLVIATGGSGHGFKFFPIIGEKIADRIESKLSSEYRELWRWKESVPHFYACDDGSRAGPKGMILDEELNK